MAGAHSAPRRLPDNPEENDHFEDLLCVFPSPWLQTSLHAPHPQAQHLLQLWSTPIFWVPSSGLGLASCRVSVSWMECLASWQRCTVPSFGVKGRREAQNTVQSSGFLPFPTSTWAEESPTGHYKEPWEPGCQLWNSNTSMRERQCRVMVRASAPSPACQEVSLDLLLRDGLPRAEHTVVWFSEVTTNTDTFPPESLLLGNGLRFPWSLVTISLPADQHITLFYVCYCLKTLYFIQLLH